MSLLGKASALATSLANKAKAAAMNVSEIEMKVLEATNLDPWGPHGTTMSEIAQASYDNSNFMLIMNIAEQRLTCTGNMWRHVYKTLLLLEFMAKRGPMRVVEYLQSMRSVLEKLRDNFEYRDEGAKDQGINVRERSKQILVLIYDDNRLRQERNKAATNAGKYIGVSSATTPNASPSATPRGNWQQEQQQQVSGTEDDALEATRQRIEKLKATGALPEAPLFEDAPAKPKKLLSEVRVNPLISAGLAGLGPPPTASSTYSTARQAPAQQETRPAQSNSASAIDLLSDLVDPLPMTSSAPAAHTPATASGFGDDDWSNFASAPVVTKPKIDIESMLNLDSPPASKNGPLPVDAFASFAAPAFAPPPQFAQPAAPKSGLPTVSATPGFGFGGPAVSSMPTAQAPAAYAFDPFSNSQPSTFSPFIVPQPTAAKPAEKPLLGPETVAAKKKLDPFADLLSL